MANKDNNNATDRHKGTLVPHGGFTDREELIIEEAAKRSAKHFNDNAEKAVGRGFLRFVGGALRLAALAILAWFGTKLWSFLGRAFQ